MHKSIYDKEVLGIFANKDSKQDVFVKTYEYSHGFLKSSTIETSHFYIEHGKDRNILVDMSWDPLIIMPKKAVEKSWIWYPLYCLGLTGATSYQVEYISSNSSINIWGALSVDAQTGEIAISNPSLIFVEDVKTVLSKLRDIVFNAKAKSWILLAATLCITGLTIYKLNSLVDKYGIKIEEARAKKVCSKCLAAKPSILRRPCMHIDMCAPCYNKELENGGPKVCTMCNKPFTSVHEIQED